MWEPRRLTTLWALTACYRDNFTFLALNIYLSTAVQSFLLDLGRFFSFLISNTVSMTPWTGDQTVASLLPTYRTAQTQNKRTQMSMPWMGFEPTIPAFERAKAVNALDGAATGIGRKLGYNTCKTSKLLYQLGGGGGVGDLTVQLHK
jgi:hypothetical protein